jgi:hypothetical protein
LTFPNYAQVIVAEFFFYNVLINLMLVWVNIVPLEIGSDGMEIWKNLGILMPRVNKYASWLPVLMTAAMILFLGVWFLK